MVYYDFLELAEDFTTPFAYFLETIPGVFHGLAISCFATLSNSFLKLSSHIMG